jgi:iron complex transport system ATP-binding protein
MMSTAFLSCSHLDINVNARTLVSQLSMSLNPGTITCILGRNGSGKSLTLHTLAGLRPFAHGALLLNNEPLTTLPRKRIAQQLAFVAQDIEEPFPVTTLDYAVSGRHPHIDFWQWESETDYAIAGDALAAVDLSGFTTRSVQTLSGGERRRLAIAMALTQTPKLFVLDEPTNHLDPQHQLQVLKLLRRKADEGCAAIMSLHDPNLVLQFADNVLLLFGDGRWQHGDVSIIGSDTMTELYGTQMKELVIADHGKWIGMQW